MEEFDLVIVGAGICGLPVAKTYLQVHPSSRLLVLDSYQDVGGTWASERLYENLQTNNLVGMLEWSDFPMNFDTFGVAPGNHVPGTVLHDYLTKYAKKFGVYERIRFGCWVKSVELRDDGSWIVSYDANKVESKEVKVIAKKLVLSTGTTSEPLLPKIAGSEDFGGEIFHTRELPDRGEDIDNAENVVVVGGSKSAVDTVYSRAWKGKHVDWVIRKSGKGPAWLSWPHVSPFKLHFEKLATTRIATFLSPCFDPDSYTGIRHFFHNTSFGQMLVKGLFNIIHGDLISAGKFNDHPETKKLIPSANIFWAGTAVGILNFPIDFFSLFKKDLIKVHIEDITSLSKSTVHLSNGEDLKSDMLVCATGWKQTPSISFLPPNISNKIGLSTAPPTDPTVVAADAEIMRRFPELKNQPMAGPIGEVEKEQTSCLLYRGIVPPAFISTRNFAYSGMTPSLRGFLVFEIQALWLIAFLDGKLSVESPGEEEAEWQAMLQNRFYRWRAPNGLGCKSTDMVFEIMPYVDTLLRELGLETRRKGGWRELFEWYGVGDYKGIVREWMEKEKKID